MGDVTSPATEFGRCQAAAGTPPGWENRGTLLHCRVLNVTANEPGRQHTTEQSSRSPASGTRKQKTRDVASHVATLQAPEKLGWGAEPLFQVGPNAEFKETIKNARKK